MSYYDRKKYMLYYAGAKTGYLANLTWNGNEIEIKEPSNWDTENKSWVRNLERHGMSVNLTNFLSFIDLSADILREFYYNIGINEKIEIRVHIKDDVTDIFYLDYIGHVDFNNVNDTETSFDVKFNADAITTLFKAKKGANVEIQRTTNLKGLPINEIKKIKIYNEGRDLLLISELSFNDDYEFGTGTLSALNQDLIVCTFPLKVNYKNDENIHETSPPDLARNNTTSITQFETAPNLNVYGYNDFIRDLNVQIDANVDITATSNSNGGGDAEVILEVVVRRWIGQNYDSFTEDILWTETSSGRSGLVVSDHNIKFNTTLEKNLLVDESLEILLKCTGESSLGARSFSLGRTDGLEINKKINVKFSEDSNREPTTHDAFLIHEVGEKLSEICLESKFKSDLLGRVELMYEKEGKFSDIAITNGMAIRGMDSTFEKFKPLSTSIESFYESLNAMIPIGMSLENGIMTIEEIDFFYQSYVSVDLGEVQELSVITDSSSIFSLIKTGYKKSSDYEEFQGLDEYNRNAEYNTILDINDNELELISEYNTDSYKMEELRRDIQDLNQDNSADDHKWFLDVEKPSNASNWILSNWTKRFEEAPKSVFSPDTARNLWFSPINILLRYEKVLKSPLMNYLGSKISFNSGDGNSNLTTKLIGGKEYSQRGEILVSDLNRNLHISKIAKFKSEISNKILDGYKYGKKNTYGLFSFTFKGRSFKGYLLKISKIDGVGDFEVLIKSIN